MTIVREAVRVGAIYQDLAKSSRAEVVSVVSDPEAPEPEVVYRRPGGGCSRCSHSEFAEVFPEVVCS